MHGAWNTKEFLGFRGPIPRAWVPPCGSGGAAEGFSVFDEILKKIRPLKNAPPTWPTKWAKWASGPGSHTVQWTHGSSTRAGTPWGGVSADPPLGSSPSTSSVER